MNYSGHETGTVIATQDLWAEVKMNKSSSCRECGKAQAGICGKKGAGMVLKARNTLHARTGDTVTVELAGTSYAKACFYTFIVPVAALIVSAYLGDVVSDKAGIEGLTVVAGLTGLVTAIVYSLKKIRKLDSTVHMEVIKIISDRFDQNRPASQEEHDYLSAFSRQGLSR